MLAGKLITGAGYATNEISLHFSRRQTLRPYSRIYVITVGASRSVNLRIWAISSPIAINGAKASCVSRSCLLASGSYF
ncbi:MAG: hypothetical protein HC784_17070 [Hydrococcus sp. CSU_1_8]|nr:hypothetical protein [Hydrococcus sp. CSU_1_8]